MKWFVYILECKDRSLYTGITTDVKRRFKEHQEGIGSHYTASRKAKKIRYFEMKKSRSAALKREAQIKNWPRVKKIKLIKGNAYEKT